MTPLRVLDAFAGAGGFSLGFQLAGCEIIGAIERDTWAAETFAANHPDATILVKDITEISDEEMITAFKGRSLRSLSAGRHVKVSLCVVELPATHPTPVTLCSRSSSV